MITARYVVDERTGLTFLVGENSLGCTAEIANKFVWHDGRVEFMPFDTTTWDAKRRLVALERALSLGDCISCPSKS